MDVEADFAFGIFCDALVDRFAAVVGHGPVNREIAGGARPDEIFAAGSLVWKVDVECLERHDVEIAWGGNEFAGEDDDRALVVAVRYGRAVDVVGVLPPENAREFYYTKSPAASAVFKKCNCSSRERSFQKTFHPQTLTCRSGYFSGCSMASRKVFESKTFSMTLCPPLAK